MKIGLIVAIILAAIGGAVFLGGVWGNELLDMALGTVTMFVAYVLVEQENDRSP
jgi:hypothetical protein